MFVVVSLILYATNLIWTKISPGNVLETTIHKYYIFHLTILLFHWLSLLYWVLIIVIQTHTKVLVLLEVTKVLYIYLLAKVLLHLTPKISIHYHNNNNTQWKMQSN